MKPRKVPPRTVKGQDIELLESDGQRFKPNGPPPEDPAKARERRIREAGRTMGIPEWMLRLRRGSLGSLGQ